MCAEPLCALPWTQKERVLSEWAGPKLLGGKTCEAWLLDNCFICEGGAAGVAALGLPQESSCYGLANVAIKCLIETVRIIHSGCNSRQVSAARRLSAVQAMLYQADVQDGGQLQLCPSETCGPAMHIPWARAVGQHAAAKHICQKLIQRWTRGLVSLHAWQLGTERMRLDVVH